MMGLLILYAELSFLCSVAGTTTLDREWGLLFHYNQ
jgi:hypothetical protein